MKKVLYCILNVMLVFLFFSSCMMLTVDNSPHNQKNTQWLSEDGNIFINSEETGRTDGYIKIGDEKIPVLFNFTGFGNVWIYGFEESGRSMVNEYEDWYVDIHWKNSFTAEVRETTFCEKGQRIVFHKLKDNEKIEFDITKYENTVDKNSALIYPSIETYDIYSPIYVEEYGAHNEYGAHIIAIAFHFAGVGSISEAEVIESDDDCLTLKATDTEGNIYYAIYCMKSRSVSDIYETSLDGELLYHNELEQD